MPDKLTPELLSQRLSKRLANFKVKDDVISKLSERVFIDGLTIKRFNPCMYGICIDYFSNRIPNLKEIFDKTEIAKLEIFPYGIIEWDSFHVRIGYAIDELERGGGAPFGG